MDDEVDPKVAKEIEEIAKKRATDLANFKAENFKANKEYWKGKVASSEEKIKGNESEWCEHIYQLNNLPLKFEASEYMDVICLVCLELGKDIIVSWDEYTSAKNELEHYTKLLKDNE